MFHRLGDAPSKDIIILNEPDPLYNVGVSKSSSKKYIFIGVSGHDTNEAYVISMSDHNFKPSLVRARIEKIYYDIEHNGDYFYIKTNLNAKNFKIVRAPLGNYSESNWQDYIGEQEDKFLSSYDISKNYLVLNYKSKGLPLIKVVNFSDKLEKAINFPDQSFTAYAEQANFEEDDLRVSYSSLSRPNTTYKYDYVSDKLSIIKVQEIPSGLNPDEYVVKRVLADSTDGVKVPISLFYKKSLFKKDGSNPLYLYGYGSYGISVPPSFRNTAISLVNRGFVYAIAHIRGGDDLGQDWYESAKFLNKKRTFEDFVASAEYLIKEQYTTSGNIVICGGSAGGLLIGNSINNRPELFKAAIAHVPFVDVINSMLDETQPLTPGEFKEWGNPKDEQYFNYMMSYDAYNNVKAQNYPTMLVTAGLSDPRVGYWEAAKWVARLRANKTDENIIILKTNMDAGHGGASGRFDYLKEAGDDIVFILKVFGEN
jgi:oligopeptidase B